MRFCRLTALAVAIALAAPAFPADMAGDVVEQMNRERAARGLPALHINEELSAAALDRIDDMFAKHYFSHVSPDGIQPWQWVDKHGYDYRAMGENLAVGYTTAEAVVDGWMHSPKHRDNVLRPVFNEVGVAVVPDSPQRPFRGPTVVALYGER